MKTGKAPNLDADVHTYDTHICKCNNITTGELCQTQ